MARIKLDLIIKQTYKLDTLAFSKTQVMYSGRWTMNNMPVSNLLHELHFQMKNQSLFYDAMSNNEDCVTIVTLKWAFHLLFYVYRSESNVCVLAYAKTFS